MFAPDRIEERYGVPFYEATYAKVIRERKDLHKFQRKAIRFLKDNPFSALFIDVGMGKSVISLTVIADLLLRGWTGKVLVIAPLRVACATWPSEIAEWRQSAGIDFTLIRAEDDDPEIKAIYQKYYQREYKRQRAVGETPAVAARLAARVAAPRRLKAKERKRRAQVFEDTTIHIINLERIEWLVELWEELGRKLGWTWPYDTVFIDESSKFKDASTKRWKALNRARTKIERLHQLTASPASENYEGLFAQLFLMDRGKRLGRSVHSYHHKFFTKLPTRKWHLRKGNDKRIGDLIADICLTMKANDHREELGVEEWLPLKRKIKLSDPLMEQYKTFEKSFILEMDDLLVEAENSASLFNKLLQMTSGAVYDAEKNVIPVHDEKIEALKELIDELQGEPLMVCYWFKSSLARLKKAFPTAVVMDRAAKCKDAWNRGEIPILLIQPGSAAHGLNLQKGPGHDVAFFDLCWSRELYEQVIGRLSRQGQALLVRVHHLLCVDTMDEFVYECLVDKGEGQERLFQFIRAARAKVKRKLLRRKPEYASS